MSQGYAVDAIELSLFASRLTAICDEMGAVLRRAAFSPNIRDRLDFSCALFDAAGQLCAQAAHIPVHLGSMAYAMRDLVGRHAWSPGDMLVLNDPFEGGTHLPDVTVVAPVCRDGRPLAFVANRAHHADIGAEAPGSMPIASRLDDEGYLITPQWLVKNGVLQSGLLAALKRITSDPVSTEGDFSAQISANRAGAARVDALLQRMGEARWHAGLNALNDYAERMARHALGELPDGSYGFRDHMESDGLGARDIPIQVRIDVKSGDLALDFSGTAAQTPGNINCPLPVTAAAVFYALRCLMPANTPACAGVFRPIRIEAPRGSLVNAVAPAAVAAGNVETSSRIVDVVLGALAPALPARIPAASQGTMNNLAMGSRRAGRPWSYYETLGGGMGAGPGGDGLSAVQTHMTNTLNTPIEVLESAFPVRVLRYAIRRGSGGAGLHRGGDGLVREYEFLEAADVTLIAERRRLAPWGLDGGAAGRPGSDRLNGRALPGKTHVAVAAGDRLTLETPGGGGYGRRRD